MKKSQLLIISLLMLTLSCLGQTSYPIALIIKGDTNILITPSQLKFANRESNTVVFLKSKTFELETKIIDLEKIIDFQKAIIIENEKKIILNTTIVNSYKETIAEKERIIKEKMKNARKQKRKAIITSGIVGGIGGLILSIFI